MVTQLRSAMRTARKLHRCGMCGAAINIGDLYEVNTNIFDGRVYDFRTCASCSADNITGEVYFWAGYPSEGVTIEDAWEWAHECRNGAAPKPELASTARAWLTRNGCTCERCEDAAGAAC